MDQLTCSVCLNKYEREVEGADDEQHPICVECITALYHGTALGNGYKVTPVTLVEYRKKMKKIKRGEIKCIKLKRRS